jgi:hypothetical protein
VEDPGDTGRSRLGRELGLLIVRYTELPGTVESAPRPLLDITVADVGSVLVPCLVDSGALSTLLPGWLVDVAGVDLSGADEARLAVGGTAVTARFAATRLSVTELTWEALVGFCDPWPYAWGLLGQESFFRWFTVTFRAADYEFEVRPNGS